MAVCTFDRQIRNDEEFNDGDVTEEVKVPNHSEASNMFDELLECQDETSIGEIMMIKCL